MTPTKYGAALTYLQKKYGALLDYVDSTPAQTHSSAQLAVKRNPDRIGLLFASLGTDDIIISPSKVSAASSVGVFLARGGGEVFMSVDQDGLLPSLEWWSLALTGVGSASLYVGELVKVGEVTDL